MSAKGMAVKDIADVVKRSVRWVYLTLSEHRQQGAKALEPRHWTGAKPKLTPAQRADLRRRILEGAVSQGFSTELWTAARIGELIRKTYGVDYHVKYIPELLKPMGLSRQKPQLVAKERDPAAVEKWRRTTWETLKKRRVANRPR